jgi:hypothetical protein
MILEKGHAGNVLRTFADPEMRKIIKGKIVGSVIISPGSEEIMVAKNHNQVETAKKQKG